MLGGMTGEVGLGRGSKRKSYLQTKNIMQKKRRVHANETIVIDHI